MAHEGHCHICELLVETGDEAIVHRGPDWSVINMREAPSIMMLMTSAHDDGFASLTPAAAARMGQLIQAMSAQMVETGGCDRTALVYVGDNALHTHMLLIGRTEGDAPVADMTPLRAKMAAAKDPAAAKAMVQALRRRIETL
jgi:diadenosine tetraphosphate (Ap4A) HIT family hydrolase